MDVEVGRRRQNAEFYEAPKAVVKKAKAALSVMKSVIGGKIAVNADSAGHLSGRPSGGYRRNCRGRRGGRGRQRKNGGGRRKERRSQGLGGRLSSRGPIGYARRTGSSPSF